MAPDFNSGLEADHEPDPTERAPSPMPVRGGAASLLVLQGRDQGSRLSLDGDVVSLGRGGDNDFRVLDSEVSRHHACVERAGVNYEIVDLGSSNGTFLNGRPVDRGTLHSGDQLQLGRTVLLFESAGVPPAARLSGEIDMILDAGSDRSQIVGSVDPARLPGTPAGDSRMMRRLQTLYEITEVVTSPATGITEVLQRILDRALGSVGAERGCVLVADPKTDQIEPRVFSRRDRGGNGGGGGGAMPISSTIVEHVLTHRQGVRTTDARRDARFTSGQSILSVGIREAMCVPLQGRYELLGVLYVDTTGDGLSSVLDSGSDGRFSAESLKMLAAIGRQAALAVETNRYQTALISAERLAAVGQTVTTLAHDMKNILQGMKGGSYLVETGLSKDDADTARRGLAIFDRNQDRLFALASDMLAFSKERRPELSDCDLDKLIQEIGELVGPMAEERRIRFTTHPAGLPPVPADESLLHRAVLNIVTNALDAAGGNEDAAVAVSVASVEDHVEIVVEDNGPGIEPAEQARLFDLFESSKGAGGTGIGLAVAEKILREHGGSIRVDSAEGQGARFRLQLPTGTAG